MSEVPIAEPIPGAPGAFTTDLPCVVCGYNLRGLMPGGRCPECGSPVDRSVHGDLLRYSDRAWLQKLLLGVRLNLVGWLWSFLANIAGLAMGLAAVRPPHLILFIASLLLAGVGLLAAILLTTHEPKAVLSEGNGRLGTVVRACAAAVCINYVLCLLPVANSAVWYWREIVVAILSSSAVVACAGMCVYLRRFALRIPNAKLARSTRIVMWGLVASTGSLRVMDIVETVATVLLWALSGSTGATTPPDAFTDFSDGLTVVMGTIVAIFGIWCVVLLFRYQKALRKAITEVRDFEMQIAHG